MDSLAIEDLMAAVSEDEGWQEGLAQATVTGAIQRLEALFPVGVRVEAATATRLRAALRALSEHADTQGVVAPAALEALLSQPEAAR